MEEYLKNKIARLEREIEELNNQGISREKRGKVTVGVYDRDLGVTVPVERDGWVPKSPEEIERARRNRDTKLYSLKSELQQARDELFKLEWNKPENVAKREAEARAKDRKEQEEQLNEERAEQDAKTEDVSRLISYLEMAGLDDLARNLAKLRFAYRKSNDEYINTEVDLRSREREFNTGNITTKREYSQIRKSVVKLSKTSTKMAKRYKDLYKLYTNAWEIVSDIEDKGITKLHGDALCSALRSYFTEATGKYHVRVQGNFYKLEECENLGYQYLGFYRDSDSLYSKDEEKHKI